MEAEKKDFPDTPQGWAQRWKVEFELARKELTAWHAIGDTIDKEFRNEVKASGSTHDTRLSVFTANVQTLVAMLYGQVPRSTVTRRWADASDDDARVAAEILERLINTDIQRDDDTYAVALKCVLMDRLLPGLGFARCRYDIGATEIKAGTPAKLDDEGNELAPEVPEVETRPNEYIEIDYGHWKDQLWSADKVFHQVRWWASRHDMDRGALVKRFGKEIGNQVPLKTRTEGDERAPNPWGRAEVWEIQNKEDRKRYWYVEGYHQTLDIKDDTLGLDGFWDFPEPMFANITTSKLVPRPEFAIHQDQYKQINDLATRITQLTDAVEASGLYDETNTEIPRLFSEKGRNKLIPVKNWHSLVEGGGITGAVDWVPVEQVVKSIAVLQERMTVAMDQLFQVSGWSDIMRGEATQAGATATEQRGKMKFGSVRIQRLQDEFARFASDLLNIKAQIIAKHFAPETIIERSNAMRAFQDPEQVMRAVQLIKSDIHCYRVEVKPESISLADFAQQKAERMEVLQTLTGFFQAMAPIAMQAPGSAPYLLQIAQWTVAGVRGGSVVEGIFDQMIAAAQQAAQQPAQGQQQPDPKLLAEQAKMQVQMVKGQQDMEKEKFKLQADLIRTQAETQAKASQEEVQRIQNVREAAQKQVISNAMKPAPLPGGRPQ